MPLCWFHLLLYHLSRYLTFQHVYFTFYRWNPNTRGQALNPIETDVHAAVNFLDINSSIANSTNTQWKSSVSKMIHIWTVVVLGATLFLPSVLHNQLIFCNYVIINAPLDVSQDHCSTVFTPVYLQPHLPQIDCHCRIPSFRSKWHIRVNLAHSQEAPQVSCQKGGMGQCIKVSEDVFFHRFLDGHVVATDHSYLVGYSYSPSNWES